MGLVGRGGQLGRDRRQGRIFQPVSLAQQGKHLVFHNLAGLLLLGRSREPVEEIPMQQRAAAQRKERHNNQQHTADKFLRKTHGRLLGGKICRGGRCPPAEIGRRGRILPLPPSRHSFRSR